MIVTLGRFSMGHFINNGKISGIHGKPFWSGGRMIVPMFHPAAALHQPSLREVVKQDFAKLPEMIARAKETRHNNPDLAALNNPVEEDSAVEDNSAEQLSLF